MKPFFLSLAAIDSSGGAGIHQDQRAAEAQGFLCLTVISACTLQTFNQLDQIYPIDDDFFLSQLDYQFKQFDFAAVKIGALLSAGQVEMTAHVLQKYKPALVVWDPVLAPSRGRAFFSASELTRLEKLLPFVDYLTPNLEEWEKLVLKSKRSSWEKDLKSSRDFARKNNLRIALSGGHGEGAYLHEYLIENDKVHLFRKKRQSFAISHGTGCFFSSSLAALLAKGMQPPEAMKKASRLTERFFKRQYS